MHCSKEFVRYELVGDGRVRAIFSDGSDDFGDLLVGADASNSRVRRQYLPTIQRYEVGVLNIAGRYPLTPATERALPTALTDGSLNNVVPPHSDWMFASAWRSAHSTSADDNYVVWAYVAARTTYPADIDTLDGAALRDLVLNRIHRWSALLRTLVQNSDAATLARVPLRSMPQLAAWPATQITLIGDAIHNMTPMAGIGANTALLDAATLTRALVESRERSAPTEAAVGAYEEAMRAYANRAVALSAKNSLRAASPDQLSRFAFRTALRVAGVVPPFRRRMFASANK